MKKGRRYERQPMPLIPLAVCVAIALYNLIVVTPTIRDGAQFLVMFIWLVCAAFAAYAVISIIEIRTNNKKLKKAMRVLRRIAVCGAVAATLFFITVQCFIFSGQKSNAAPGADYIIIMGGGLDNGLTPSHTLRNRLDTALEYIEQNPETIVIVTGGQGPDELIPEADAMKTYLVDRGVPSERILTEDKSHSTDENFRFSRALVPEGSSVVVVSNEFHLYRCVKIAGQNGFSDVMTLAAPTPTFLLRLNCHVREFFAVVMLWLGL